MGQLLENENISKLQTKTNTSTIDLNNKRLPLLIATTTLYL